MSKKYNIKLAASDLDGTLLQNGAQKLNSSSIKLITKLLDSGVYFVAASGRQYSNLRDLFRPIANKIDYICENGCLVFANGKLIHQEIMHNELAHEVIETMLAIPNVEIMVSGVNTCYLLSEHEDFIHHVRDVVGNNVTIVDDLHSIDEPYFKISLFSGKKLIDPAPLRTKLANRCQVVTGGNAWIDVMPAGVSKASAMQHLLRFLHLTAENVIAFGDEENDIEMMKFVGLPVAMDNAIPRLKEICKMTTPSVDAAIKAILSSNGCIEI